MSATEEALAAILTKAVSGVEQATTFILAEAPLVVQQLIMWNLTFYIVMAFVFSFIGLKIFSISKRILDPTGKTKDHWSRYNEEQMSEDGKLAVFLLWFGLPMFVPIF